MTPAARRLLEAAAEIVAAAADDLAAAADVAALAAARGAPDAERVVREAFTAAADARRWCREAAAQLERATSGPSPTPAEPCAFGHPLTADELRHGECAACESGATPGQLAADRAREVFEAATKPKRVRRVREPKPAAPPVAWCDAPNPIDERAPCKRAEGHAGPHEAGAYSWGQGEGTGPLRCEHGLAPEDDCAACLDSPGGQPLALPFGGEP